jgi:hypothetical protein
MTKEEYEVKEKELQVVFYRDIQRDLRISTWNEIVSFASRHSTLYNYDVKYDATLAELEELITLLKKIM